MTYLFIVLQIALQMPCRQEVQLQEQQAPNLLPHQGTSAFSTWVQQAAGGHKQLTTLETVYCTTTTWLQRVRDANKLLTFSWVEPLRERKTDQGGRASWGFCVVKPLGSGRIGGRNLSWAQILSYRLHADRSVILKTVNGFLWGNDSQIQQGQTDFRGGKKWRTI